MLRDAGIALGAFAAVSLAAVALGAANLGTAMAFGQLAFAAAVTYVLVRPTRRLPVVDMIETRESTRSGWRAASVCAIIPPIEAPTTWAAWTLRWSSRPAA